MENKRELNNYELVIRATMTTMGIVVAGMIIIDIAKQIGLG